MTTEEFKYLINRYNEAEKSISFVKKSLQDEVFPIILKIREAQGEEKIPGFGHYVRIEEIGSDFVKCSFHTLDPRAEYSHIETYKIFNEWFSNPVALQEHCNGLIEERAIQKLRLRNDCVERARLTAKQYGLI